MEGKVRTVFAIGFYFVLIMAVHTFRLKLYARKDDDDA